MVSKKKFNFEKLAKLNQIATNSDWRGREILKFATNQK